MKKIIKICQIQIKNNRDSFIINGLKILKIQLFNQTSRKLPLKTFFFI